MFRSRLGGGLWNGIDVKAALEANVIGSVLMILLEARDCTSNIFNKIPGGHLIIFRPRKVTY